MGDPDCVGDLLLMGIALARWVDYGLPVVDVPREKATWKTLGAQVLKTSSTGHTYIEQTLRSDIRRYDPIKDAGGHFFRARCGAPMVRREGPCGGNATQRVLVADAETGRKSWLAACSRHKDWFNAEWSRARTVEPPRRPIANAGGVLARHIPDIDWPHIYRQIDPAWEPPPEGDYDDELVVERPKLRLILGGAS